MKLSYLSSSRTVHPKIGCILKCENENQNFQNPLPLSSGLCTHIKQTTNFHTPFNFILDGKGDSNYGIRKILFYSLERFFSVLLFSLEKFMVLAFGKCYIADKPTHTQAHTKRNLDYKVECFRCGKR